MSRVRSALLVGTTFAVVLAACASGSDGDPDSAAPDSAVTSPAETTASTIAPPAAPATEPVSYDTLSTSVADGEVDELTLALSEFSALFTVDLPGAVPLVQDDSLPTLGTDVVRSMQRLDDELTDEQRSIIESRLDEVFSGDVVYRSVDDPEYQAVVAGAASSAIDPPDEGDDEPEGFARPRRLDFLDEDEVESLSGRAAIFLQETVGGPPLNFVTRVGPPGDARTPSVNATTRYSNDGSCDIVFFDWERMTGKFLRSVVAHEVFHCWQGANAPSFASYLVQEQFFYEGMATWVGEQYASGSPYGDIHWTNYFSRQRYPLFDASYSALGFWSQVAHLRGGPDAVWSSIPDLNNVADNDASLFNRALDGVSDEDRATLAATAARQPGWSAAWDFSAVGIPGLARVFGSRLVDASGGVTERVQAGQQAITNFDLSGLPGDVEWVVNRQSEGLTLNRWDTGDDFATVGPESLRFCYGGSCECPDGTVPFPDIQEVPSGSTAIDVALTGSANAGASVTIVAQDIESFCDEPTETTVPSGSGSFDGGGAWRASNEALVAMFTQASGFTFGAADGGPLSIAGVTGDVIIEFFDDGTGTLTYDEVQALINDSPVSDFTINGVGHFQYGVESSVLTVANSTFNLTVTSSALFGESLTLTERDIESGAGGTTSLVVGFSRPDQLVLIAGDESEGPVFFPLLWDRL